MNGGILKCIFAAACAGAAGAAMADVTVSFVNPGAFTDLPRQAVPRQAAIDEFSAHFRKLGSTLPPGQDLAIDVLDIDLAGQARPTRSPGEDLRILSYGVNQSPHVVLRYSLSEGGRQLGAGTVDLTTRIDPRDLRVYPAGLQYPREMGMIDAWWRQAIAPARTVQR